MTSSVSPYPATFTTILTGGESITAIFGPVIGGIIVNPQTAQDQGISVVEPLYIDVVNPAASQETSTTIPIQPGQFYTLPTNLASNVSVNAATSGHKFSAFIWQQPTPYPPIPPVGPFPPPAPTTLTKVIPSYLYQEYSDDDDLQAFVTAYNGLAQQYVTWFATSQLPIYVGTNLTGALLDWVAEGLYGITRPALASEVNRNIGPFNTYKLNTLVFNGFKKIGPQNVTITSDDIFKRVMTWDLYKGDGKLFNIRWLKRRIMRFLIGVNGTAPNVDNTDQVSVTFGVGNQVDITLISGIRNWVGGSRFNKFKTGFGMPFNTINTTFEPITPLPNAAIFQEAVEIGVLQLPFQFDWTVII